MTKRGILLVLAGLMVPAVALADGQPAAKDAGALRADAQVALRTMEGNAARVQHLLQVARAANARRDTACLDATLSRADAAVRMGRDQARLVFAAIDASDGVEARHHFALLSMQREASRSAARDAESCAAHEQQGAVDGTSVRVFVDPTLPTESALPH